MDRFGGRFIEEGRESICGWLKDKFGVSWQIVPEFLSEKVTHGSAAHDDRLEPDEKVGRGHIRGGLQSIRAAFKNTLGWKCRNFPMLGIGINVAYCPLWKYNLHPHKLRTLKNETKELVGSYTEIFG